MSLSVDHSGDCVPCAVGPWQHDTVCALYMGPYLVCVQITTQASADNSGPVPTPTCSSRFEYNGPGLMRTGHPGAPLPVVYVLPVTPRSCSASSPTSTACMQHNHRMLVANGQNTTASM
jgi:hypothetical protein